ncbi:MAG: rod shape-determining protein MreC [Candidatus Coprovivens sp.]
MQNKYKVCIFYIIVCIFIVFSFMLGNIFSYLRFDDKKYVSSYVLGLKNKELEDEVRELRKFVNSDLNEFSYVIGKVKYRDLYDFNEEIVIDVKDVSKGDAVVNSEGLVGIVVNDKGNVKLLTSTYNVSVSIGECYGNLSNGSVDMVDKECNVREGDKVYTSGLGNIVKGIYVGSVSKVGSDSLGLVLDINLIDNSNLNYVGVIK